MRIDANVFILLIFISIRMVIDYSVWHTHHTILNSEHRWFYQFSWTIFQWKWQHRVENLPWINFSCSNSLQPIIFMVETIFHWGIPVQWGFLFPFSFSHFQSWNANLCVSKHEIVKRKMTMMSTTTATTTDCTDGKRWKWR